MFHVVYTKNYRFVGQVTRIKTIKTGIQGVRAFVDAHCDSDTHVIVKYARTGQPVALWA